MKNLNQQITEAFNKMLLQEQRAAACKNHTYEYVGYFYCHIDGKGTIGRVESYRCKSCRDELQRGGKKAIVPKGFELNKIYK